MDIPGNNDLPFDEDPDGFRALQPNLGSLGEQRAAPVAPPTPIPPQSEPPPPAAALPAGYERPIPAEEQDYADKRGWKTIDGLPWGTRKIAAAPAVASTFVPPPAPGIAAIQPGAPTGRQIITHQPIVSPAEAQAAGAVDQVNAAERANAEKAGQAGVDHASQEAQQADREAAEKQRQLDAADALRKQYAKTISDKKAEDDAAYQRYRSVGLKDPDADASFGHRVAAAIALGLGAYSAAINHTSNGAAQVFEQARKDNLELQKAAIERAREDAVRAGKSVDEARAEANQALHDLQVKGVAQIDAMRSTFAAESKRLGVNDAQIAGSKMMTDLDKSAAEAREKHLDSLRVISRDLTPKELKEKTPGGGGGGASAAQQLARAIREGADDGNGGRRPLTYDEEIGVAGKLKIPVEAKGSQVSLSSVRKGTAFNEAQKGASNAPAVARDERGNPMGIAPSARALHQFETRDADYRRAADQLKALDEDIQQNGIRVFGPDAVKRRNALYKNASIAVATVSPLGKTDEAMKTETASLGNAGSPGEGVFMGANPDAIRRKLAEISEQRQRYRNEELAPITDQEAARAQKGMAPGIAPRAPSPSETRSKAAEDLQKRRAGRSAGPSSIDELLKRAGY